MCLASVWAALRRGAAAAGATAAEAGAEAHGISAFGDLKYPADFHHFDYVNVDAPKGGMFSPIPSVRAYNQSYQTFNSLNAFILKGEGAQGMDLTFAALMARAGDEPDAMYGFAAKSVQISPDKLVYRFTMRPEARFHDGSKLTAHDAAFSLTSLKTKGHPLIIVQMRDMVSAEALTTRRWSSPSPKSARRDVPLYVAGLPIFSKAYYAAPPFDETTLDTPLGLGPVQGRQVRGQSLHRIRARQGLVGRGPAGLAAAATISTSSATNSIATATSPSKALPARTICSARNSPRASGRRATTSRQSRTAASSGRTCRTRRRPARRAGSSTRGATSSRTRACARR